MAAVKQVKFVAQQLSLGFRRVPRAVSCVALPRLGIEFLPDGFSLFRDRDRFFFVVSYFVCTRVVVTRGGTASCHFLSQLFELHGNQARFDLMNFFLPSFARFMFDFTATPA